MEVKIKNAHLHQTTRITLIQTATGDPSWPQPLASTKNLGGSMCNTSKNKFLSLWYITELNMLQKPASNDLRFVRQCTVLL